MPVKGYAAACWMRSGSVDERVGFTAFSAFRTSAIYIMRWLCWDYRIIVLSSKRHMHYDGRHVISWQGIR